MAEAQTGLRNFTINFGPQHPAAHGVLRLIMELDGEVVERVDPHIGLLHRGTEKLIEYKTYAQALPYFDRLDYCSPMCMEHSFVLAIEKLMGLEVPLRAQYIRVLMAELTRISNHLLNLGSHIMDVDAISLVADNRIFKQRNVDIAKMSKEDSIAWGFSGPMIRAAGLPWDLRKSQ